MIDAQLNKQKNIRFSIPLISLLVAAGVTFSVYYLLVYILTGVRSEPAYSVITDIELYAPPKLPPPPEQPAPVKQVQPADISVDVTGIAGPVSVEFNIQPSIAFTDIKELPKPDTRTSLERMDTTSLASFPIFQVEELDATPKIIKTKGTRIAKSLRNQGIKRVETKIEIVINETGKAFIKKIIDPGYSEMVPIIREHISYVRFTPPTKFGKPVNAVYIYSLNFSERI